MTRRCLLCAAAVRERETRRGVNKHGEQPSQVKGEESKSYVRRDTKKKGKEINARRSRVTFPPEIFGELVNKYFHITQACDTMITQLHILLHYNS